MIESMSLDIFCKTLNKLSQPRECSKNVQKRSNFATDEGTSSLVGMLKASCFDNNFDKSRILGE